MNDDLARHRSSVLRAVPLLLLGITTVWAVATWFRREYNHDDFFFAYFSWIQTTGLAPFRDYYVPNFAVLPQLAAPLFRFFPESFLPIDLVRVAILFCIAAVTALVFAMSRALGASRQWATLAALLWLCHPDVILRMSDIRTDAIAAMFLLASALAIVRVGNGARAGAWAGVSFGLALVVSFKTCLAAPFLLIAIGARMGRRSLAPLAIFSACAGATLLADYAWNIRIYGLDPFLAVSKDYIFSVKVGHAAITTAPVTRFLLLSPVTALLLLTGLFGFMARGGDVQTARRGIWFTALVGAYVLLTIAINPFLFPYNSLLFVPLLAPIASGTERLLEGRVPPWIETIILGASAIVAFSYGALALGTVTSRSNASQRALVNWIWRSTARDEHVFDWQGVHFGRPGIVHWWNYSGLTGKYASGWYSLEDELRKGHVTLVIDNYRLRWMTPADKRFFTTHFVHFAPCIYAPGAYLPRDLVAAGAATFEVFVPGDYRVVAAGPVQVDGSPAGAIVKLGAGSHHVSAAPNVDVALYYTTALRERQPPPCPAADDALLKGFD